MLLLFAIAIYALLKSIFLPATAFEAKLQKNMQFLLIMLNFFEFRVGFSSHNNSEVIIMAEKKRHKKPVISGETVPFIRSYHAVPFINMNEIPPVFGAADNDLAVDNMANDFDMTAADKEDFRNKSKYRN